jgi:cyclopropane fatty-acyl-phospholipid synthase-like methyltransferase
LDKQIKNVEHNKCRLCGNSSLEFVFSIGNQYINDFVTEERIKKGNTAPLDIVYCSECDLSQLKHTAPQELLYSRQYWYRSGVTDTMKRELKDIVDDVASKIDLNTDDIILDIGANDGTMLEYFPEATIRIGCEPANNLVDELATRCDRVIHDFWSESSYLESVNDLENKKVKVVCAIGMFYDLDDPVAFVSDIEKVLDDDGIFVAQLMTLAPMLEKNDLGNICHEHIEFYSYKSLVYMYEKCGLEVTSVSENSVNGGSYRIFARKYKNGSIDYPEQASKKDLLEFKERIDSIKNQCIEFIEQEKLDGKTIHVYGASTKGNVILQYFELDTELIEYAAERSPEKFGRYTVGSWIPIISEQESRDMKPDYYFVLPWAFFDEMYERESEWRSQGGKFIVPFPEFRIVE